MNSHPLPSIRLEQQARLLPADVETPVSLFMGMRRKGGILLESTEVDGRWGRYSVMASDMLLTIRCRQGTLALETEDARLAPLKVLEGTPFVEGLRQVLRALHVIAPPHMNLPPLTRAVYGYLGFGMAGLFSPKLAASLPPEQAECTLVLPRTVVLADHLYNRLCQISIGEHEQLRGEHGTADTRIAVGPVTASPDGEGYKANVRRIQSLLGQGEAIQVVPSVRFSASFSGDAFSLYRRIRTVNPSPYMFYMQFPHMTLLGASPEVMVRCTGGMLQVSPIAGTRARGATGAEDARLADELVHDPKERAEHVMLVDLGRNDLGRLAKPGSVRVDRLMDIERFSHVMHMTSRVTAELQPGMDALDVLAATFPAGTVSGAPKVRAMELIAAVERQPRGPYAGCIGWLGLDKDSVHLDTGITIRSAWLRDGVLNWQAGGGIVHDSDPDAEWMEVCNKSAVMRLVLNAVEGESHVSADR